MTIVKNFAGENTNIRIVEQKGCYTVIEHIKDLSVSPQEAQTKYFMEKMGCRQRQVLVNLNNNTVRLAPGEMQFMLGNVNSNTGVKGAGDLFGKVVRGSVTGNAAIKPLYQGTGLVMTEPSYRYYIIENVSEWGGAIVTDDGMFCCCDNTLNEDIMARTNVSSAILGKEGLFNLCLTGNGLAVFKAPCPREELYEIILDNDTIKIDGNNAVCWSAGLQFTVERSGKSLIGSMASGEGFVNVYRGSGKILMAPLK